MDIVFVAISKSHARIRLLDIHGVAISVTVRSTGKFAHVVMQEAEQALTMAARLLVRAERVVVCALHTMVSLPCLIHTAEIIPIIPQSTITLVYTTVDLKRT